MDNRIATSESVATDSKDQPADFGSENAVLADPIVSMLLRGEVETAYEAEEMYLDANLHRVIELVESPLSDEEFRAHPLITLLLSHGSRDWEDSIL